MLKVTNLYFQVGETQILNGVDFTVSDGERLGLIGPNGSGKTTLFNCLSGFNFPSAGEITFKDKDITKLAPHRRAELGLGRVFQNFGVFRQMSVLENIITALETKQPVSFLPWDKFREENRATGMEFLKRVGLEKHSEAKAGSLSGGQMRLLEITRSLAFGADLFLLDEPTAGVSPKMKDEVEQVLRTLHDMKKTVLIIEHDINFIQKLCERIIVMDVGKVVLDDTPEKVRKNKMLHEIYFGSAALEPATEA